MKKADAPSPGWYPDPELPSRLRWWDGLDWTDIRRPRPSDVELDLARMPSPELEAARGMSSPTSTPSGLSRQDTQEIISEVRNVARSEVDRAVQVHGALGVTDDTILAFFYREERAARIYDGPDEVHKLSVARRMLKQRAARA